jgi:hypothetical protein
VPVCYELPCHRGMESNGNTCPCDKHVFNLDHLHSALRPGAANASRTALCEARRFALFSQAAADVLEAGR